MGLGDGRSGIAIGELGNLGGSNWNLERLNPQGKFRLRRAAMRSQWVRALFSFTCMSVITGIR